MKKPSQQREHGEKLWDAKGKEPLGKKVFYGFEAEGEDVDNETEEVGCS